MGDTDDVVTIPSHLVKWWPEIADGRHGDTRYLVQEGNKVSVQVQEPKKGQRLLVIFASDKQQPKREDPAVTISGTFGTQTFKPTDPEHTDAVFWNESAVEKFVWPYYHSQRIWSTELEELKKAWEENEKIVAIGHVPPSQSFTIPGPPPKPHQQLRLVANVRGKVSLMTLEDYRTAKVQGLL